MGEGGEGDAWLGTGCKGTTNRAGGTCTNDGWSNTLRMLPRSESLVEEGRGGDTSTRPFEAEKTPRKGLERLLVPLWGGG